MYNYLVNATKERIILELREYFSKHPVYKKLEIFNRFPYEERIQEGIIVKSTSANETPLSADNFQGTVFNYVTLAKHKNSLGMSIEWVKEDELHLSNYIRKKDVSDQFLIKNRYLSLPDKMIKGKTDLSYANENRDVSLYVNGIKTHPSLVDGYNKTVILAEEPPEGSKVEISYWVRNLTPPGVYQIEIIEGIPEVHRYKFIIDPLYDIEEIIIRKATGTEVVIQLPHTTIYPGYFRVWENDIIMDIREYTIDFQTGILTFLTPPLGNSLVRVEYRIQGDFLGPFEIPYFNHGDNTAIPGVVIAFGRAVSVGDRQFIIISKNRDTTAHEYSGKWEMSVSVDAYSKDSYQIEEIIDLISTHLLVYRKSDFDNEGIALVSANFGGESEQVYDENIGDMYYMGTIDFSFLTEWIAHFPLLPTIEGFTINSNVEIEVEPYFYGRNRQYERII